MSDLYAVLFREVQATEPTLAELRQHVYDWMNDHHITHQGSNILPWWMLEDYAIKPWCRPNGDPLTPGFRLAAAEHQRQPHPHRRGRYS